MSLFVKSAKTQAFLKAGLMGFAGSGKTYTATEIAIGLHHLLEDKGLPGGKVSVNFLDTETGSDWVEPQFRNAGIQLAVAKTRRFADLVPAVKETAKTGGILLIDSITHFWRELTESYARQRKRKRLQFQDWAYLKEQWGKFTDEYVNSPCHIILCGRAGFEYQWTEDQDGQSELRQSGIRMKAETETGYEPSLLILMQRKQVMNGDDVSISRRAIVLKDRSQLLDARVFTNPTFENFKPHVDFLNLGGDHLGVDTSRTSDDTIEKPDPSGKFERDRCEALLDDIQGLLTKHFPGQAAAAKKRKVELLQKHFGHPGWVAVTQLDSNTLRGGLEGLAEELGESGASTKNQAEEVF